MKTYYCVTTTYDNFGNVTSEITDTVKSNTCPDDFFEETKNLDIYKYWFATKKEANEWVKEAYNA